MLRVDYVPTLSCFYIHKRAEQSSEVEDAKSLKKEAK